MSVKYVGPVGLRAGLLVMWTPSRSTKIENAQSSTEWKGMPCVMSGY